MRILITGVGGQIGSYAAGQLLEQGADVLGVEAAEDAWIPSGVTRCPVSLGARSARDVLAWAGPLDAVLHLAGQAGVGASWEHPLETFQMNAVLSVALVSELVRQPAIRLVHASSAEIFGVAAQAVQDAFTPIHPISPYGVSKAAAHIAVRQAREGYGAPTSNIVFYNGESERRAPSFVFRKITSGVAAVALGRARHVELGAVDVVRDFSHASDLASAAALLAVEGHAGDYLCGSGEGHSIRQVAETACAVVGLDPDDVLRSDPSLLRPLDPPSLVADAAPLRALGWAPKIRFETLVHRMVTHDMDLLEQEAPGTGGKAT